MSKHTSPVETVSVKPAVIFIDEAIRTRDNAPTKKDVEKLAERIKREGQLQSVGVRKYTGTDGKDYAFTLMWGEHRLEACKLLGIEVRCDVYNVDESEAIGLAFAENAGRKELTPLDRYHTASLYRDKLNLKQKDVAVRMGLDNGEITRIFKLAKLSEGLKKLLKDGKINMAQAIALLEIADEAKQVKLAEQGLTAARIIEIARSEGGTPSNKRKTTTTTTEDAGDDEETARSKQRTLQQVKEVLTSVTNNPGNTAETYVPLGAICERMLEYIAGKGKFGTADVFDDIVEKARKRAARVGGKGK